MGRDGSSSMCCDACGKEVMIAIISFINVAMCGYILFLMRDKRMCGVGSSAITWASVSYVILEIAFCRSNLSIPRSVLFAWYANEFLWIHTCVIILRRRVKKMNLLNKTIEALK